MVLLFAYMKYSDGRILSFILVYTSLKRSFNCLTNKSGIANSGKIAILCLVFLCVKNQNQGTTIAHLFAMGLNFVIQPLIDDLFARDLNHLCFDFHKAMFKTYFFCVSIVKV